MALGIKRAVFSFVMEQTSFRRTVSYTHTHTHTHTHTQTCTTCTCAFIASYSNKLAFHILVRQPDIASVLIRRELFPMTFQKNINMGKGRKKLEKKTERKKGNNDQKRNGGIAKQQMR